MLTIREGSLLMSSGHPPFPGQNFPPKKPLTWSLLKSSMPLRQTQYRKRIKIPQRKEALAARKSDILVLRSLARKMADEESFSSDVGKNDDRKQDNAAGGSRSAQEHCRRKIESCVQKLVVGEMACQSGGRQEAALL